MSKREIPEWKIQNGSALNVFRDLGLDCDHSKLVIFKNKAHKTGGYKWRWLPPKNKDIRKIEEGKKRLYYSGSTGESDPYIAGRIAIKQLDEKIESIEKSKKEIKYNSSHSLHHYWEIWYSKFSRNTKFSDRNKRDRLNQWKSKEWGIASQEWSKKSIDQITPSDIHEYFLFLDSRGDGSEGSMAQQKENQRTILNKLNHEAQMSDFPSLRPFRFPKIARKKKQVEHFFSEEWDLLIKKIIELSGGNTKEISKQQYQELPNEFRQWVDLYDALMLMWFFYLRSEDIPRIQTEWFTDRSNWIYVKLEKTKQDRLSQETEHFRPDGYDNFKKIQLRKPSGYLSFPSIPRKSGAENDSNVGETANRLLKEVVKLANIKKKNPVTLTTIRHTSMRLTLEEYTDFQLENNLRVFADNANTSIEMLRKTYIKYSDRGKIASKARNAIKPRDWSLKKRVEF